MGKIDLGDYIDVAARIVEFRTKFPEGCLQLADPARPYSIETVAGQAYVVVVAAAYRTPDDPRPGIGTAWERIPGLTPYTKGSEIQNAETSAWGRAMVAALAVDTKAGIASADEIRNRSEEQNVPAQPAAPEEQLTAEEAARRGVIRSLFNAAAPLGITWQTVQAAWAQDHNGEDILQTENVAGVQAMTAVYLARKGLGGQVIGSTVPDGNGAVPA